MRGLCIASTTDLVVLNREDRNADSREVFVDEFELGRVAGANEVLVHFFCTFDAGHCDLIKSRALACPKKRHRILSKYLNFTQRQA